MSCNTCQLKYSLFTRENACPKCGFSYCSKCLKYKCKIPNVGVKKVCGRCSSKLESNDDTKFVAPNNEKSIINADNDERFAPIDFTRLKLLENPAKPPIIMYAHGGHWDKFKCGLEPADREIVDRLKKLKGEDSEVSPPSIEDIRRRLALLKDQDPESNVKPIDIHKVDTRTDEQKIKDVIKEYLSRLELSAKNDSTSEIRSRLDHLKGFHPTTSSSSAQNDVKEDDEAATKKIIKKALAEAALEKKYEDVDELDEMEVEAVQMNTDDEDRPSCVMCDQTTDLLCCQGCHGDLYCTICFEDNHDDFELGKHKSIPFKPAKRSSSG